MKNTGVIRKIDELGRIVIPKEIRKNLNIRNGEDVQIYVEDEKIVLKKYQKVLTVQENVQKYLLMFSKLVDNDIYITDREQIIASSNQKHLSEKINNKILTLINDRKQDNGYSFVIGEEKIDKFYFIYPLIIDADAIGAVILFSKKEIDEKDKLVIEVINSLLSMEFY